MPEMDGVIHLWVTWHPSGLISVNLLKLLWWSTAPEKAPEYTSTVGCKYRLTTATVFV